MTVMNLKNRANDLMNEVNEINRHAEIINMGIEEKGHIDNQDLIDKFNLIKRLDEISLEIDVINLLLENVFKN